MGCFLGCFGFSKKKRKRKPASGDHRRGSYVPLDSSLTIISVDGPKEIPNSDLIRDKAKEQKSFKIRKKVSFNLNVQTYEPITTSYNFLESDDEEEVEKNSTAFGAGLFSSNYRYQNVRDSYEEEEYIEYEESELDDNDVEDEDDSDSDDIDDQRISQEGICKQLSKKEDLLEYSNGRDNNIPYVHSVLSPVENLSQWKAAKAKAAAPKHQKENKALCQESRISVYSSSSKSSCNQSRPLLQEIPVNASLSSWLNSQSTI